ncbi:MAG: NAD(P)/FAD-dependent oxidoreductase [Candidatus Lokiarchaeota archaeon]|nr:NAD(P)/FAD-dependent oxidoreductase [Candidatus Lokiarchaeota archaeon]
MNKKYSEVIIIGAGPAGCAAAIQLKRSGFDPLIFEKDQIGGLANNANFIENYLGFPNGINGSEFVNLLEKHILRLKIKLVKEEIIEITWDSKKNLFYIQSNLNYYKANYLILAIGTIPKRLSIIGEEELNELDLLFYEPTNIKKQNLLNKRIAVIGAGDAAFDYSLQLEKIASQITIFNRKNTFHCLPLLMKRVEEKSDKIKIIKNKQIIKFEYKENQNQPYVVLEFADKSKSNFDIILIAIGRIINSFLIDQLAKENPDKKKLYKIGDVKNGYYRQISIAVGDGIKCAMKIINDIKIRSN